MLDKIRREPVLVYELVGAVLALAVAFGVDLTKAQTAALLGVTTAVMSLLARRRTTPVETRPVD